jgi:hypothetical protein
MKRKGRSKIGRRPEAGNDNQAGAVQSGAVEPDELWSVSDLIPLVRLLARQAAAEMFFEAANDNRRSSKTRPKE